MRGKVLVFYANAVIFATLALLGLLLGLFLTSTSDCGPDPTATCERGLVTGQTSLAVSAVLAVASVALALVGAWLHLRDQRSR